MNDELNTADVAELLTNAFMDEKDLRRFCRDSPEFRAVLVLVSEGAGLQDHVDVLISYSESRVLFNELLAGVKQHNPRQYALFAAKFPTRVSAVPEEPVVDTRDRDATSPVEKEMTLDEASPIGISGLLSTLSPRNVSCLLLGIIVANVLLCVIWLGLTGRIPVLISAHTPTFTPTHTLSATSSPTLMAAPIGTPSATPSGPWLASPTSTPTSTLTLTPSATPTPTPTATPSFTPSPAQTATPAGGGRIAFTSWRHAAGGGSCEKDCNTEIYTVLADGSEQVRITDNPSADFHPAISPDGQRIAFCSDRTQDGHVEIFVKHLATNQVDRVTRNEGSEEFPAWSPDGQHIAYTAPGTQRNEKVYADVFVIHADGTGEPQNLTKHAGRDSAPSWSPDGNLIAFSSWRDGSTGNTDIWVIRNVQELLEGGGDADLKRLTTDPNQDLQPAWSPDGRQIVFVRNTQSGTENQAEGREIWVMNRDGSDQRRLTASEGDYRYPSWSPDGTLIAFSSGYDSRTVILIVRPDGNGLDTIPLYADKDRDSGKDEHPCWEPPRPAPTP